ncbi:MAG: (2E,6E)-farnesyl diphosphate synthase [Gammaproteobacteria bacterium]|nr:(2E,6E)-farnesyl diphosphate synthase [Gammaproteobacteria bacterium]
MPNDATLQAYLTECAARVEAALAHWLPAAGPASRLHEAMRYAALGGGKRVRPVLVYAAGRAVGAAPQALDGPACAVELVHAYSLVHDDLPAMDDDDLRRGRPTCHRAFDEATAILAGDALQTLAFQVLCEDPAIDAPAPTRLEMVRTLAHASGARGMVGGQSLDLDAAGRDISLAELERLHIHKTGALIRASVRLGTLASAAAPADAVRSLDRYAKCVGLAFQIRDDVLDVTGDTAVIGKTRGKDVAQRKSTYPALLGLAGAREKCAALIDEALAAIAGLGETAEPLRQLAQYVVRRDR